MGKVASARYNRVGATEQVLATITVTEPAAVERVLRGLTSAFSIGTDAKSITCSMCKTGAFENCLHTPLEVVDGKTIEWVFHGAEILEISECPIPAVPESELIDVRVALSAAGFLPSDKASSKPSKPPTYDPRKIGSAAQIAHYWETLAARLPRSPIDTARPWIGSEQRLALGKANHLARHWRERAASDSRSERAAQAELATAVAVRAAPPANETRHGILLAHRDETAEQYLARRDALTRPF
jgi:hypothetical protein